jgi:hypothetical protein
MTRKEKMAYVLTAVLGGSIAGYIGGTIAVLGVFSGLAIVGYADMLIHLAADERGGRGSSRA